MDSGIHTYMHDRCCKYVVLLSDMSGYLKGWEEKERGREGERERERERERECESAREGGTLGGVCSKI